MPLPTRQRRMVPQQAAVGHLIQGGNAHPVFVRRDVLGLHVHGHLGQVQIGADARRGRDAGGVQNVQNDAPGKLLGGQSVEL